MQSTYNKAYDKHTYLLEEALLVLKEPETAARKKKFPGLHPFLQKMQYTLFGEIYM